MLGDIWNLIIYNPIHNVLIYFYSLTSNLGISILLIIVLIRVLLTPLVIKQFNDMKKLSALRPRLQELQKKYKDKPTEMAAAQQALYKEVGYNPLGCFTNLIFQLPILIALYQSVLSFTQYTPQNMPNLYPFVQEALNRLQLTTFNTDFLGISLLSSPASQLSWTNIVATLPYIVLIILLGISNFIPSYVNLKYINPQPTPAKQKEGEEASFEDSLATSMNTSTMYVMPFILTISMVSFPSIIAFYIIFQNTIATLQQVAVKMLADRKESKKDIQTTTK